MSIQCVKIPDKMIQECPLCNEPQGIMMRGLARDLEDNELFVARDRGYSFCNCNNIFFTDWANIKPGVSAEMSENDQYVQKHEIRKYLDILKENKENIADILTVGKIPEDTVKYLESEGVNVVEYGNHVDVAYVLNAFQGFRYPGDALNNYREMLREDGLLYISMPDTFFINFEEGNPLRWDWHVQENHILWNMENFIDYAEQHGFKCVFSDRNLSLHKQESKDTYWKKDFKVILRRI